MSRKMFTINVLSTLLITVGRKLRVIALIILDIVSLCINCSNGKYTFSKDGNISEQQDFEMNLV